MLRIRHTFSELLSLHAQCQSLLFSWWAYYQGLSTEAERLMKGFMLMYQKEEKRMPPPYPQQELPRVTAEEWDCIYKEAAATVNKDFCTCCVYNRCKTHALHSQFCGHSVSVKLRYFFHSMFSQDHFRHANVLCENCAFYFVAGLWLQSVL